MDIAEVTAAAKSFIDRVHSHSQIFRHFQQVMMGYSTKKLNVAAVVSELDMLFQNHPDLLTGYRIFLPPEFQASSSSLQQQPQRQSRKKNVIDVEIMNILNPCIDFMNKVQKRFADERGVIGAYLYTIRALTQGKISNEDAYNAIAKIFGNENQDLVDAFELLLLDDNARRKKIKKKKSTSRSNSLDFINTRKLNDLNLSKRMEDEMYELDMDLFPVKTIVKSAKDLMDSTEYQQHQKIKIDEYFCAVSLSCIRKEYKEQGCYVIELLREHPKIVLPLILKHLESKEKELVEAREKLHEYWYGVHKQKQNSVTNSSLKEKCKLRDA